MGEWIYKFRNEILLVGILLGYLLHASNGVWVDDFWDHSAVVSELIRHPWHPQHPQLGGDLPHAFFSPYSLFAAMMAKLFNLNSIEILSLFGILNASVLFYGLSKYIESLAVQNKSAIFFYSIIFILFLWGENPWNYSGFFHYSIINFILPYPSAFATGLVFLAFAVNAKYKKNREFKYLVILSAMSSVIVLTHPVAFVFLCAGLAGGAAGTKKEDRWHLAALSLVMLPALTCAFAWPYYPFMEMLRGASNVYHPSNKGVYENIINVLWPILLTFPFVAKDFINKDIRHLSVAIILLLVVYIVAWQFQKYSYGRVISYIAMMFQIIFAIKIAQWDAKLFKYTIIKKIIPIIILIACIGVGYEKIYSISTRSLTILNSFYQGRAILNQISFANYTFLEKEIAQGDIVLANVKASWIIPSFGAKAITLALPHAFVVNHEERIKDVSKFYSDKSTADERQAILKKYMPKYVLINKLEDNNWWLIAEELLSGKIGQLKYEDLNILLYKIKIQ